MKLTIAITGANGFLGSVLVSHFLSKGDKVIAFVRANPRQSIAGVEYALFDLSAPVFPGQLLHADVLIHTAYVAAPNSKTPLEDNLRGTTELLRHFPTSTRKIFISSISADEKSPAIYGRQKAAVEKLFLDEAGCAMRPGLILGNGGLFANMRDYLRNSINIPLFNSGSQPLQTVFVDDLVLAIDKLTSCDYRGVVTFCEREPVSYKEFYAELCRHLNVKPRFINIPFWVASCAIHWANIIGIKLPINSDNLLGLRHMRPHSSQQGIDLVGISPGTYKENLERAMRI